MQADNIRTVDWQFTNCITLVFNVLPLQYFLKVNIKSMYLKLLKFEVKKYLLILYKKISFYLFC